jgi:MFS transporter, DHA2 family, methylenomycin A resistance protein
MAETSEPMLTEPRAAGADDAMPAMTSVAMASADRSLTGSASGVFNTARQSGGALGTAVLGTLSTVGAADAGVSVLLRIPMLTVAAAYLLSIGCTMLCTTARGRPPG